MNPEVYAIPEEISKKINELALLLERGNSNDFIYYYNECVRDLYEDVSKFCLQDGINSNIQKLNGLKLNECRAAEEVNVLTTERTDLEARSKERSKFVENLIHYKKVEKDLRSRGIGVPREISSLIEEMEKLNRIDFVYLIDNNSVKLNSAKYWLNFTKEEVRRCEERIKSNHSSMASDSVLFSQCILSYKTLWSLGRKFKANNNVSKPTIPGDPDDINRSFDEGIVDSNYCTYLIF